METGRNIPRATHVPSNDFQHYTDGNQHSYQEFPPQQQYFGYYGTIKAQDGNCLDFFLTLYWS